MVAFGAQETGAPQTPERRLFADSLICRGQQRLDSPLTAAAGPLLVLEKNDQIDHRNDQFAHFPRQDYTSF
ncbi:hypothetical protein [Caballeronia mineralivorans]|uniref:hypothetical protein n=1 Tax=Caballeronia mineralivorans TaxID=2010198 RepID=UPI0023F51949|nr:hypothetical protein [Caballeronia mineralivorans]